MMLELSKLFTNNPIMPVLTVEDIKLVGPLSKLLHENGIRVIELTLRTACALEAINIIKKKCPEMIVGAGTIITKQQVKEAISAGAEFGLSPGINSNILEEAGKNTFPFIPGICTPSDIEKALEFSCKILKFFPAIPAGGLSYLKSIATPYNYLNLKYIPLGGLDENNFIPFLQCSLVPAIGGSWIASKELISDQNWKKIKSNINETFNLINSYRAIS